MNWMEIKLFPDMFQIENNVQIFLKNSIKRFCFKRILEVQLFRLDSFDHSFLFETFPEKLPIDKTNSCIHGMR